MRALLLSRQGSGKGAGMGRNKKGQFTKGSSGNKAGRPRTESAELRQRLAGHGPALTDKLVELALEGDVAALRACLERVLPPLKAVSSPVLLPDAKPGQGLAEVARVVLDAATGARIGPDDAQAILSALASAARVIEIDEIERRLQLLEQRRRPNHD